MRQPDDWAEHEVSVCELLKENETQSLRIKKLEDWLEGKRINLCLVGDTSGEIEEIDELLKV